MAVTFDRSSVRYVGPVRVWTCRIQSGGTAETFDMPFRADSVTNNRVYAVTHSPLSSQSVDAHISITAISSNKTTFGILGGAANDQHRIRVWNLG